MPCAGSSPSARRLFRAELATCEGALALGEAGFAVLVVAHGRGEMHWDGGADAIAEGQTWVVAHGAGGPLSFSAAELHVIVCRLPDPGAMGEAVFGAMKAVLVEEPGRAALTTLPDPTPADDEIVVAVGGVRDLRHRPAHPRARVAHRAVPARSRPRTAGRVVPSPECARFAIGDRVAIDPSLFCGRCEFCRRWRGYLASRAARSATPATAPWAEYVRVPVANPYWLPDRYRTRPRRSPSRSPARCAASSA